MNLEHLKDLGTGFVVLCLIVGALYFWLKGRELSK